MDTIKDTQTHDSSLNGFPEFELSSVSVSDVSLSSSKYFLDEIWKILFSELLNVK